MTNASIYFDKHIIIIFIIINQHNLARRREDESSKMAPTQWCQIRVPSSAHITSAYCTRNANGLLADPHYSPQFSLFWAEDIFFRRRHRYSRLHEILFFFCIQIIIIIIIFVKNLLQLCHIHGESDMKKTHLYFVTE